MAHDAPAEAAPRALAIRIHGDLAHGERVQPWPEHAEDRRQERQCPGHGQPHDDRAGDTHRPEDHELEEDQPDQTQEHGEPGEEDRSSRRRDRDPDGRLDRPLAGRAGVRVQSGSVSQSARVASSSRKRLVSSSE